MTPPFRHIALVGGRFGRIWQVGYSQVQLVLQLALYRWNLSRKICTAVFSPAKNTYQTRIAASMNIPWLTDQQSAGFCGLFCDR